MSMVRIAPFSLALLLCLALAFLWLFGPGPDDRGRGDPGKPGSAPRGGESDPLDPAADGTTSDAPAISPEIPSPSLEPEDPSLAAFEEPLGGPREGTELAFYRQYLEVFAGSDEAKLEEAVARFHEDDVDDAEKVAMLRASYDAPSPLCAELFLAALEELPVDALPGLQSVPAFAFRFLGERIGDDPVVREILEIAIFDPVTTIEPRLRRRAISRLVAASDADELADLRLVLAAERGPLVRLSIASELARHPDRIAADRLARDLGLTLPEPGPELED